MTSETISKADFGRRARQVVDQVKQGTIFVVESDGQEQVAILDILDYRLLSAVAHYQAQLSDRRLVPVGDPALAPRGLREDQVEHALTTAGGDPQAVWNLVIGAYLDGLISLGRGAELLDLLSFDLRQRFVRLGLLLQLGPATIDEARAEVDALRGGVLLSA